MAIAGYRGDTATAFRALAAADPNVRAGALTALLRCAALDHVTLTGFLSDRESSVVRRAVELAAHAFPGEPALDEQLLKLLTSDDDVLVEVTAWALGERHQESVSALAERVAVARAEQGAGLVKIRGRPMGRGA